MTLLGISAFVDKFFLSILKQLLEFFLTVTSFFILTSFGVASMIGVKIHLLVVARPFLWIQR